MIKSRVLIFTAFAISLITVSGHAQGVMGALKKKAAQMGEKQVEKELNKKTGNTTGNTNPGNNSDNTNSNNSNPSNKGGGGLVVTPPDVNQNIADAGTAYKASNYSEARYAVKQAMLGVEMEIGQSVLKSLPENVIGLKKDESADQVTSTGAGWVGLTIQREYEQDDKQVKITIANNAAWMASYNAYMMNSSYATTGGEQNWKQTKVKGYKGIIEYSDASGYKLSVPLGQSSLIVWEGINVSSEQEMMNAASAFDIDGIKKKLGEK